MHPSQKSELQRPQAKYCDMVLDRLLAELARFADGQDFPDDVSAILLEFSGPQAGQIPSIVAA